MCGVPRRAGAGSRRTSAAPSASGNAHSESLRQRYRWSSSARSSKALEMDDAVLHLRSLNTSTKEPGSPTGDELHMGDGSLPGARQRHDDGEMGFALAAAATPLAIRSVGVLSPAQPRTGAQARALDRSSSAAQVQQCGACGRKKRFFYSSLYSPCRWARGRGGMGCLMTRRNPALRIRHDVGTVARELQSGLRD